MMLMHSSLRVLVLIPCFPNGFGRDPEVPTSENKGFARQLNFNIKSSNLNVSRLITNLCFINIQLDDSSDHNLTFQERTGKPERVGTQRSSICGLVVRVLGYRSGGQGSIPGTTRFSEKKKENSSGSGTGSTQPCEYN
jgi:hypothetical protein